MGRKINIRPTTSVYATYKNINYDIWTAIAEFVDNSSQSYYDHQKQLEDTKYWDGCNIEIKYEKDDSGDYYLEIKDNAYGMDFNDFQRAIVLDSPPKKATRSEFGMGLKTAACWFGMMWSVESTELGSDVKYRTTVDIDALSKYKNEEIEVEEEHCNPKEHGTTIKIWKMNRTIIGKQVKKTKDMLSGIYRVDLRSGNIKIIYNDESLVFEDPEIFEEVSDNKTIRWENDSINFEIDFEGKKYHVDGRIFIRKTASIKEAGLTLIRRGRVIIGGYQNNYRPEEVFGQPNSFEYQRLAGELNMDDWPVVQTKDNFDWKNGLEDIFLEKLKEELDEYIKKSRIIRIRKKMDTGNSTDEMVESFEKAGVIESPQISDSQDDTDHKEYATDYDSEEEFGTEEENDVVLYKNTVKEIKFEIDGEEYLFLFKIEDKNVQEEWLKIVKEGEKYYITWNVKHPFFSKFIGDPSFVTAMQKFIFAFAISEIQSGKLKINGQIEPGIIRKRMNEILKQVGSELNEK